MINVSLRVNATKVFAYIAGTKKNIDKALDKGLDAAGKSTTDYIKYNLLEGQLVGKISGELQRGIYFRRSGKHAITILIRGAHKLAGEQLNEGTRKGWWIPKNREAATLRFKITRADGYNVGGYITTEKPVWHPKVQARRFLETGLKHNRKYIIEEIEKNVSSALRRRTAG